MKKILKYGLIGLVALFVIGAMLSPDDEPGSQTMSEVAAAETDSSAEAAVESESDDEAEPAEEADEESDEPAEKPEKKSAPAEKPVKVEAAKMVKEFEKNELAADSKYKGKDLRITGVVSKIDTDVWDDDKYILALGSGDEWEFLTVNCNDMPTEELSTLEVGQTVTVLGTFDDGGDLGVEVKDCRLP